MIKNEIINVQNKHTKVPKSINEKPKVKNLIIPTITLNIPFINLYSLCFGSITTLFLIQQTFVSEYDLFLFINKFL